LGVETASRITPLRRRIEAVEDRPSVRAECLLESYGRGSFHGQRTSRLEKHRGCLKRKTKMSEEELRVLQCAANLL